MYQCKTYQGENARFLRQQPYNNLKGVFLNNVNYERCFIELFNFLDGEHQKLLNKFMINILSNPNDWTIAELQELFNKGV